MPIYEILSDEIRPIQEASFGSAGLRERHDLQRLLREQIEIISPETMVLAEEYGEWDASSRRIDLLGLDKDANLVVIELKRTEDGGFMDLQALRYAAMVSTMTFDQAVEALSQFNQKRDKTADARQAILDFLEWEEADKDQFAQDVRVVLVSANFSKELTTAVMWLNERSLDIRCVRMKPYTDQGRTLVDIQQVLPLPEAREFQIQVQSKAVQERVARRAESAMSDLLKRFWASLLAHAQQRTDLHARISPVAAYYVGASYGRALRLNYCIGHKDLRVELYIDSGDAVRNKELFDALHEHKGTIESAYGGPLSWERLDNKQACRIKVDLPGLSMMKEEDWPEVCKAMVDAMIKFEAALKPYMAGLDR